MDRIKITRLPGGMIKVETDAISDVNHLNAEKLVAFLEEMAGGQTQHEHKREGVVHDHAHHHKHDHEVA